MLILAKLLVIIFCFFVQLHNTPLNILNVSILLAAFILGSLTLVLKNDNKINIIIISILWIIFLVISFFIPVFTYYLPIIIFDILEFKSKPLSVIWTGSLVYLFINAYYNGNVSSFIFIVLITCTSILLHLIIAKNNNYVQELKYLRDTSKEHELLIEEKNRRLIEKQDAELYTATLKERNRIAREIHDNVGHMLTRSILQVGAIKTINNNELLNPPLEGLHETLNSAMTNIRNSVHDLHDESIDLKTAVEEIIQKTDKIHVKLNYDMSNHVNKSVKYCFISIIKEAVNNTIKHSNASHIDIIMQEHPAFYQLLIHDNGTDISNMHTDGIGLTNMRDRIKALNGNIKISTDKGFKISITILKNNLPM